MGDCLLRACPCLEALWQRFFSDKKASGAAAAVGETSDERRPTRPAPPPQERPPDSVSIYMAIWAFESRHPDEISFREGDLFNIVSRVGDWWTARRIDRNGQVLDTGIVPRNYLARAESLEMQP